MSDTGTDHTMESQAIEEADLNAESSDIDEFEPEIGEDGKPQAVPYERFKESREQLRTVRDSQGDLEARLRQLEAEKDQLNNYAQWAHGQLQQGINQVTQPQQASEYDEFADPLEQKVTSLERKYEESQRQLSEAAKWRQEALLEKEERRIESEISDAQAKYPWAERRDILEGIRVNPYASVGELAKRSHRSESKKFEKRAGTRGMKVPPRSLQRGGNVAAPRARDYGDNLEDAEAGAIEFLKSIG